MCVCVCVCVCGERARKRVRVYIYLYTANMAHLPGDELRANLKSIAHSCFLFEVAFVWELPRETIHLPLGCLQGGIRQSRRWFAGKSR